VRRLTIAALVVCAARLAFAQGGPPMITDDPGTPGNGHFENNVAATIERGEHDQLWQIPNLDLNYGVGDNIQLNLETSFNILKRDDHGPIGGLGSASLAVKWRFLDQDKSGVSMSIYPRVEWNTLQSSVRRGLVDDGTHVLLPWQVTRKIGIIDVDVELGSLLSTVGRSEWIYGIVGGVSVTSTTYLMAELHGSARSNFDRDRLTPNFGLRQKLNEHLNLIASLGTDARWPAGDRMPFIGYLGAQFEY
jgi:hypothetical protein